MNMNIYLRHLEDIVKLKVVTYFEKSLDDPKHKHSYNL